MRAKETEVEDLRRAYEASYFSWAPAGTTSRVLPAGCMVGNACLRAASSSFGHTSALATLAQPHVHLLSERVRRTAEAAAGSSLSGSIAVLSAKLQAGTRTKLLVQCLAGKQSTFAECGRTPMWSSSSTCRAAVKRCNSCPGAGVAVGKALSAFSSLSCTPARVPGAEPGG